LLELGDHRGIIDDADESRIADVAGAYGVELCALARVIQIDAAGLGAADLAPSSLRDPARREQLRPTHRVAEGGVVFDNPRERLGQLIMAVTRVLPSARSARSLLPQTIASATATRMR
jgi:hypothetical protein